MNRNRLIIAIVIAAIALIGYYAKQEYNPITGEKQHIGITPDQEIALGLQAAPEMEQRYGGLSSDSQSQAIADKVGQRIVSSTKAKETPYKFEFHLLDADNVLNAFALPGGQVFITSGLLKKLQTEGQLAGALGHEIGHVIARHGAEHIAETELTQGLTGAAVIATYDPNNPNSRYSAAVAALIGQLVNLRFSREDELEADTLGVRFTGESGYDPHAMIGMMEILDAASKGEGRQPEFFSTHPNPDHRIERIQAAIKAIYPQGVRDGLTP
jgi:beta-barrel assembly-enhancing protease